MKLLILTCLLAFAFARPSVPLRSSELIQSLQNEQDSISNDEVLKEKKLLKFFLPTQKDLREEYVDQLNRETESASNEEAASSKPVEKPGRVNKYNPLLLQAVPILELFHRMNEYQHRELPLVFVNQPFQQFYQLLDAHPSATWYYPLHSYLSLISNHFSVLLNPRH